MVNALASFDPIGAYQGAKERQLGIQAKEADLALQPQRNELSQLQLQEARQGLETASLSSQQQKALTASQFIINANQALKGIPLPSRSAALQTMLPQAQQAGIDVGSLDLSQPLTDDVLNNAIQSASTIVQTLQGGTGEPASIAETGTSAQKNFATFRDLMTTARESGSEADLQSAEQFGRGAGFLPKDVEGIGSLSAALEKRLFDAQDAAVAADRQVAQAAALSSDFERLTAGGTVVSMAEFIKRVTGTADEASELRRQFNEVRLSRALKNLPPGPATDKDVEQAFKGVPPENAPPEQVQSFLRGVEKMSALDAEFNRFKSNYISKKKTATGMLEAWDLKMEIGDSPALESFGEEVEEAPQAAPAQPATSGVKFLGFE